VSTEIRHTQNNKTYVLKRHGDIGPFEFVNSTGEVIELDEDAIAFLVRFVPALSNNKLQLKERPTNAGKPWDEELDLNLRERFSVEKSISRLANEFGRTRGAIESRLSRLGLMSSAPSPGTNPEAEKDQ